MKIAFPIDSGTGLESEVFGHFGSATKFVIVDSESGSFEELGNNDLGHEHSKCNPLKALGGAKVDAVVSGGIGQGALNNLRMSGIKVFRAEPGTISKNLELFKSGSLMEFMPGFVCSGHAPGGGCSH